MGKGKFKAFLNKLGEKIKDKVNKNKDSDELDSDYSEDQETAFDKVQNFFGAESKSSDIKILDNIGKGVSNIRKEVQKFKLPAVQTESKFGFTIGTFAGLLALVLVIVLFKRK